MFGRATIRLGIGPHSSSFYSSFTAVTKTSSAVAKMGDRFAINRHRPKSGSVVPLSVGMGPHLSQFRLGRGHSVPSGILIHPTVWPQ